MGDIQCAGSQATADAIDAGSLEDRMGSLHTGFCAGVARVAARLVVLFVALWSWDRVVTDCAGRSESTAYYYFQATVRQGQWILCRNSQNQLTLCYQVLSSAPIRFGPNISDPGVGTTVSTSYDPVTQPQFLPVPPVGAFVAWPWPSPDNPQPVVAVDYSGNAAGQVCQ